MNEVSKYAASVLSGDVLACHWVRLACQRFVDDLSKPGLVFLEKQAQLRFDFFEKALTLENGEPFILPDWQKFIVGNLYGWFTKDGNRRFQQALILVPRKNAKSTLVAGIGIASYFMDDRPYSQYYCVASDRGQATLLKDYGEGFVKRSPALAETIDILTWEMRNKSSHGKWKALHADHSRLDGLNPYWVVFDEFHSQEHDGLDNVINSAFGSQAEYMYIKITTAGEYKREKPCVRQQHYGEQVLEGTIVRDNFFFINYTIDEGDDWTDPDIWQKANPNLGISKNLKYMADLCQEAQDLPSKQADFNTKQLNVWVESDVVWMTKELWDDNGGTVREEELNGLRCFGGLDLARTRDLSALVWIFPPQAHLKKWTVLPRFWIPEMDIEERSKNDRVPYQQWRNEKLIQATEGNATDFNFIKRQILEDVARFNVQDIGFDRYQADELVQSLMHEGVDMVSFGQGFISMSMPTGEIERLCLAREMNHGNHKVLAWNCSNCVLETDAAGNIKISKKKSYEKVDGMVALAMAVGRSMSGDNSDSVYEERDIRIL